MLFHRQRLGVIILFLTDIVILFLIFSLAIFIRKIVTAFIPWYQEFSITLVTYWWFFPAWMAIMVYESAYSRKFTFWDEVKLLWKVSFFSSLVILIVLFIGKMSSEISRTVIVLMGLLSMGLFPPLRIAVKRLLIHSGMLKSRVLIVGTGDMGKRTLDAFRREPNLGYEVVGFIDDSQKDKRHSIGGVKIYGRIAQIDRYVKSGDIQDVVIALPGIDKERLSRLINKLQHKVKNVLFIPDVAGLAVIGTELRHFFHDQLLAVEIKNNLAKPFNYFAKRMFDYIVGITLLIILGMPLAVISVMIRLTSPGPAIFKHRRMGRDGRSFHCYKFRTMYKDSEERLMKILEKDPGARDEWENSWKLKHDPRITQIGNFLRKTSLDELPQIFNVLKGEMSLVGPRPVVQDEITKYYKDAAKLCFSVLPGITGLWQVSGRSDTSYEHRISLDSWYVRNWNLWLDIVIIIKTVGVVLKKEGAV